MADAVVTVRPPTGGGGAGNWTDDIEEATLDGGIALEVQDAAPSATADYAKIYVKPNTTAAGAELLFNMNGNVEDSSSSENDGTASTTEPVTYAVSGAGGYGGTGFGQSAVFDGTSETDGGDSFITFDRVDLGTGDFTVEFWVKFAVVAFDLEVLLCSNSVGATEFIQIYRYNGTVMRVNYSDGSGHPLDVFTFSSAEMPVGTWIHMAFVREGESHRCYSGLAGAVTGDLIDEHTHTAYSVGADDTSTDTWVIGRMRDGVGLGAYNFTGELDEFLISNVARYSGAEYTVPTAPYITDANSVPKLFALDGAGNETQLIP